MPINCMSDRNDVGTPINYLRAPVDNQSSIVSSPRSKSPNNIDIDY